MKEQFLKYSKIAAKGILFSVLIIVVGNTVTLITGLTALFQSLNYLQSENIGLAGGHAGDFVVFSFLIYMALHNFVAFLLIISLAGMTVFYFIIAKKYAVEYLIHSIWNEKAEELIMPKVEQLSQKAIDESYRIDWLTNKAVLKIELLNQVRKDPESKGLKKHALNYLFKKSGLNEIDFNLEKHELPNAISIKIAEFIRELTRPSWRIVWIAVSLQFLLLIISQFFYK